MTNRLYKLLITCLLMLFATVLPLHARNTWESVRSERVAEAKQIFRSTEIEVRADKGAIYITTSRPVQVKVFSILGQLVSQDTIQAGTSRLQLSSHGIFIVKIGDITCKVAL